MFASIKAWIVSLLSHNKKTVAEIVKPLTDIHAQLDSLHVASTVAATVAQVEADAHTIVAADALNAKAKIAQLVAVV
jgi:hypothetical protein